tara:strand:- start:61 stop:435 length:375 start_codon:yes stop_codon:yes gene_type:complete
MLRTLAIASIVGLSAVLLWAVGLAYLLSVLDAYQPKNSLGVTASGTAVFIGVVIVGTALVLFYGAPAYSIAKRFHRANSLTISLIGLVPGLVLLPFNPGGGALFMAVGASVAWAVHVIDERELP